MAIDTAANNKRIAKNTLMLYFRMLFSMLVSLYTSRVVLQVLGVEDYGIYNVVGGFVAMFSLLSRSLNVALQRFFAIEIGLGNNQRLASLFCTSINIFIIISVIVVVLGETIGMWFFYHYLNIPDDRFYVAMWVYQIMLISFIIGIISIPYSTLLMAHEYFNIYAYISILEVVFKLCAVIVLPYIPFDKLIIYSVLLLVISIVIRCIYAAYCSKHFQESKYKIFIDRALLKEMFSFTSWNFLGSSALLFKEQGVNVIMNIFCGVVVNAARGIANQVFSAVYSFVYSFITAVNPQINKLYAQNNYSYLYDLIFKTSRFSYYLVFVFLVPIVLETEFILKLWLGIIPNYTVPFVQLLLVNALLDGMSNCLHTLALAVGRIALYQTIIGGIMLLNIPASIILLHYGYNPEWVLLVGCILSVLAWLMRVMMLHYMIQFPWRDYLKSFLPKISLVTISSLLFGIMLKKVFYGEIWSHIIIILSSIIATAFFTILFGMSRGERQFVMNKIKKLR